VLGSSRSWTIQLYLAVVLLWLSSGYDTPAALSEVKTLLLSQRVGQLSFI